MLTNAKVTFPLHTCNIRQMFMLWFDNIIVRYNDAKGSKELDRLLDNLPSVLQDMSYDLSRGFRR